MSRHSAAAATAAAADNELMTDSDVTVTPSSTSSSSSREAGALDDVTTSRDVVPDDVLATQMSTVDTEPAPVTSSRQPCPDKLSAAESTEALVDKTSSREVMLSANTKVQ